MHNAAMCSSGSSGGDDNSSTTSSRAEEVVRLLLQFGADRDATDNVSVVIVVRKCSDYASVMKYTKNCAIVLLNAHLTLVHYTQYIFLLQSRSSLQFTSPFSLLLPLLLRKLLTGWQHSTDVG